MPESRREETKQQWIDRCYKVALLRIEELMQIGRKDLAVRLHLCMQNWQVYRGRIIAVRKCRLRNLCPVCHNQWASGHAKRQGRKLRQLVNEGYKLYFLTLTVASTPTLTRYYIVTVWAYWVKLRRQKLFDGCAATLACLDVKTGGGWLVHLHIIVAAKSKPPADSISFAWHALTGSHEADIRPVKVATVETVIRYSLKGIETNDIADRVKWHDAIRDMSCVRATGRIRGKRR